MNFTVGDYFVILKALRAEYDRLSNTHVAYRNDTQLMQVEALIQKIEKYEV